MSASNGFANIDDSFVALWEPQYDDLEDDEEEYQNIVSRVALEILRIGTITETTFLRVINWKSCRTKGKIDWRNFHTYMDVIRQCLALPGEERLHKIDELQGIGPCVGSTFLHFIYPDTYPIYDIRTVEVLRHLGADIRKSRSVQNYDDFRVQIIYAQITLERWTLRKLDRALFAFHKLNPEIFGSTLSNGHRGHSCGDEAEV
ncbi:hypothetical protein PWR05_35740 [Paraburkholderia sp. A2RI-6]|uniref:hypothetical protein n=1 Tax=Paraburkholderia sp. A2RI-6 TaxID=3028371 RepID=UPI003B7E19C0